MYHTRAYGEDISTSDDISPSDGTSQDISEPSELDMSSNTSDTSHETQSECETYYPKPKKRKYTKEIVYQPLPILPTNLQELIALAQCVEEHNKNTNNNTNHKNDTKHNNDTIHNNDIKNNHNTNHKNDTDNNDTKHTAYVYRDTHGLVEALPYLLQLEKMIGQTKLKHTIFQMAIKQLQYPHLPSTCLRHFILYGKPGLGKTTFLHLIANVLSCIGYIKKPKCVIRHMPTDFIAKALGQTAPLTEKQFRLAKHGILVIDELQNISDNRHSFSSDSYSKSCADTLNVMLTEWKDKVLVIGCGYKEEIQTNFFSLNPGLKSRFPLSLELEPYTSAELHQIGLYHIQQYKLHFTSSPFDTDNTTQENKHNTTQEHKHNTTQEHKQNDSLHISECEDTASVYFQHCFDSVEMFPAYGRSVVNYVDCIVTQLSLRVFGQQDKQTIVILDVEWGWKAYLQTL